MLTVHSDDLQAIFEPPLWYYYRGHSLESDSLKPLNVKRVIKKFLNKYNY